MFDEKKLAPKYISRLFKITKRRLVEEKTYAFDIL